jgi:hypothetical protein
MKRNVGNNERILRALAGLMLVVGAVVAPWSPAIRFGGLGLMGAYLMFTAVAGSCLGYRLMGRSTCPLETP